MKILKFIEFVNENEKFYDKPEEYIGNFFFDLKNRIDKLFKSKETDSEDSFDKLGVKLESSEICKYSKIYDSLQIKFSDDTNFYSLYIMVQLENVVKGKSVDENNIDMCFIKFKKYNTKDLELLGTLTKNMNPKEINKDFIISLKVEIDGKSSDNADELKIEYKDDAK